MNIEQKVMVLRELRKQHAFLVEEFSLCDPNDDHIYRNLILLVQEKIEQILKTI